MYIARTVHISAAFWGELDILFHTLIRMFSPVILIVTGFMLARDIIIGWLRLVGLDHHRDGWSNDLSYQTLLQPRRIGCM